MPPWAFGLDAAAGAAKIDLPSDVWRQLDSGADITTLDLLRATRDQHLRLLVCIKAQDVPAARAAVQANKVRL